MMIYLTKAGFFFAFFFLFAFFFFGFGLGCFLDPEHGELFREQEIVELSKKSESDCLREGGVFTTSFDFVRSASPSASVHFQCVLGAKK